jgi:HEAT repeat protein
MKKNIFQLFTFLLLIVAFLHSAAQDHRTLDTKVADILAQMPTNDLVHRDRVMAEMAQLGTEGFQKFSALLVPAGTGDDTAVRFAINSLARYASDFGKEEIKTSLETQLLQALESHSDTEVKTFLLNQLNLVASDKSVDAIKKYLSEKELTEPATQTLTRVGSEKAAWALFEALPNAGDDATKTTLINALGVLQYRQAADAIAHFAETENPVLRKAALAALANIGASGSYNLLYNAAKEVDFIYEPTNATEAFLNYTAKLGEENQTELCKKACKAIFKASQSDDKLHNYSKALAIYSKYFGSEALPLLLKAVENGDKSFRYSALNLAEKTDDIAATRAWIQKAENSSDEIKAEIIDMLGRKGDGFAVDFISKNLDASSPKVREESINALLKLQGKKTVPALIHHLAEGQDIEATKNALLQLLYQQHLAPVAKQMEKTSGKTKAAFIDLIAAKSGRDYFDEIYALTNSDDSEEKAAAFKALKNISAEKNLDRLLQLLLSVNNETEIEQTQLAVIAAAAGVDSENKQSGKILTALKSTDKKDRLIAVLPEVGGDVALETVAGYFNNSTGKTKETAFEALTSWKEYEASKTLFEICQTNTSFREKAFASFIRQVRSANLPDDQKLLQYRKVMPFAKTNQEKTLVINSIGNLKTFLSLVYLEQFLDDDNLEQTTARAIMRIALPGSEEDGFSGDIARTLLERVASIISGDESDYDKINIRNYLEEMPKEKGFVPMFNGKNLDGWQGMLLDGNPVKIAKLSEKERNKAQEEANKKMLENWSVRNGQIIFNGHGANLVSAKEYKDFELVVDWKITKEGDSGIYLRGTPQVQIWDTSRVEVGAQVGSGGLYNNNADNIRNPLKVADNPINEWNTFRITMIGENVTVYLNGELVVDNVRMDNYWDRSIPIFESGTIELQAHGNELAFRDIYVREINTDHIGLSDEEIANGFVSLFNGKNLDGWQGNKTDYYAENGELVVNPERGGHGNLFTEKEYSDFVFRFDFQLTPGANNGLGIRAPLEGDAAYVGMELQILDNTAPIYANLHEYQYHGSVYGVIPAKRGFLNPVGEWNSEEVIVQGSKIKIILNGETILDGDIKEASKNGTLDGNSHPGLEREKGYIGFLGHGSELKFKNIRIKDLSK